MPNEKKSACGGQPIGHEARRGAARSSCRRGSRRPRAGRGARRRGPPARAYSSSSASNPTSGIMISSRGGSGRSHPREHDRLDLHLVDLGVDHAQPATARPKHRVDLTHAQDELELLLERRQLRRTLVARALDALGEFDAIGKELVQRRVEQADRDRLAQASPRTGLRSPAAAAAAARPARRAARARYGP